MLENYSFIHLIFQKFIKIRGVKFIKYLIVLSIKFGLRMLFMVSQKRVHVLFFWNRVQIDGIARVLVLILPNIRQIMKRF